MAIWAAVWFAAFIIPFVLYFPVSAAALVFAPLIPACLCFVFPHHYPPQSMGLWLVVPYLFYLGLTVIAMRTRKTEIFILAVLLLCVALVLNIYGCMVAAGEDLAHTTL